MDFDLVIHGGEVVDPAGGFEGHLDVGIRDGSIAAVDRALPTEHAREVLDASGQIVTPGLVDSHTHIYWGATYWGIEPDPIAARSGVTTWVDAGSAGGFNFPGFRRWVIDASDVRVYSLLNISSIGLTARTYELATPEYVEAPLARQMVELNRDVIVGIKARIDRNTTRGTGIEPLRTASQVARQVDLPLMVHVGLGPPPLDEIVALLRPGDILTHCATGHDNRVLEPDGSLREFVRIAWDHGLILDVGHGTGSFSFEVAERMLAEGMPPDVISTDIHQLSVQGPMFDMPTTLSKFLALGMSLPDVIERATARPAQAIGRSELGTLRPGSPADVAVFRVESGEFTFHDVFLVERTGRERLVNTATIRGGKRLEHVPMPPLQPWSELPEHQRAYQKPLGEDRQLKLI